MSSFIKKFNEIGLKDLGVVGGKNASLGEMFTRLSSDGIRVPDGFASTDFAFWHFIDENKMRNTFSWMRKLDLEGFSYLKNREKNH
jgi:pyruvate,water dikinase